MDSGANCSCKFLKRNKKVSQSDKFEIDLMHLQ